ncbi:hypothetical protein [Haliangium sp. UPWRP_2]|uniref:hypothetical protein n=1 Tax=Haliangium sp. UPWRP_2 TaxID=1931276 RepID=UPI0011B278D0|nr:hypothetical protein [Haliangium sp. UPWRP_2]
MNAIDRNSLSKDARLRHTLDVFRFAHSGRWPILRSRFVRRRGDVIFETARWLRMRTDKPYCAVVWNLCDISVRWKDFRTLAEAKTYLQTLM